MAAIIDTDMAERLAASFLVDRLGVDHGVAARLLDTDVREVVDILEGRGTTSDEARRQMRAVVAAQSLLLSAYTPDGMQRWFETPCPELNGRSPLVRMGDGDPTANGDILAAAYARISS